MLTNEQLKEKVKDKGYMSLDGEERKAYQALKKEDVVTSDDPETPEEVKKITDSTKDAKVEGPTEITITPEKLQEMINEGIESYRKHQPTVTERKGEWKEVEPGAKRYQTATLKLYQKDSKSPLGAIVRVDYLKMVYDEESRKHDKMLYELEIMYDGGKSEVIEMDAMDYTRINQTEKVELIDLDRKKMRLVSGKVGVPMKDKDGYPLRKVDGGGFGVNRDVIGEVEMDDIKWREIFTVRRPNGEEFQMHSKYLNN